MPTLYSLLALPAAITDNLQYFAIGAAALIVIIAFIVGCARGCSRMGWGAIVWGVASTLFLLVEIKFHDKNPLLKMGAVQKLAPEIQSFIGALSVALAAILVSCIVFGLFAALARSKNKEEETSYYYYKEVVASEDKNEDGDDEYKETENVIYVPEETYKPQTIGGFNRFIGGLFAVIQTAVLLAAIASVVLLILNVTPLAGKLSVVYASGNKTVSKLWSFAHSYTLDLIWIALIAGIAVGGFRAGFLRGFAGIFQFVGTLVALAFFAVPFISTLTSMKMFKFVGSLSGFYGNAFGKINAIKSFAPTLGKICCGLTLAIACALLVTVLCWLLRLIARSARRRSATFRFFDGIFSFIVMLAVGVAVCLILTTVLYLPEYFGTSFKLTKLFGEDSTLAKGFYDVVLKNIKPLFDKIAAIGK